VMEVGLVSPERSRNHPVKVYPEFGTLLIL
jgi:hypothetical protein